MSVENSHSISTNSVREKWRIYFILLLVALAVEIYFLIFGLGQFRTNRDGDPIAELVSAKNNVKIQPTGELVWDPVASGETLYRRESLLTLDRSGAELAFSDGSGLTIGENTLVELERVQGGKNGAGRIVLRLLRGSIKKRAALNRVDSVGVLAPNMDIVVGKDTIEAGPKSEFSINAKAKEDVPSFVQIESGQVILKHSGTDHVLREGEQVTFDLPRDLPRSSTRDSARKKDLFPKIRTSALILVSPTQNEAISPSKAGAVEFKWMVDKAISAGNPMILEMSGDPDFSEITKSLRIAATEPPLSFVKTKMAIPVSASSAAWYWRVRILGDSPTESKVEKFWTEGLPRPSLRFPSDQGVANTRNVDFVWNAVAGAVKYELSLNSKDVRSTVDLFAKIEGLERGEYSWKVRAYFQDGSTSDWSEQRRLTIMDPDAKAVPQSEPTAPALKKGAPPPPPDELLDPEIRQRSKKSAPKKRSWLDWLISTAYADDESEMSWNVHLKWKPVRGVSRYQVQIGTDPLFKKLFSEGRANVPEYDWVYRGGIQDASGNIYYRVASVSKDGQVGMFSQPKPFPIPQTVLEREKILAKRIKNELDFVGYLDTGYGGMSQSSAEPDLVSVESQRPFLQQKLEFSTFLTRTPGDISELPFYWVADARFTLAGFHKPDSIRTTSQPDVTAFTARLSLLRSIPQWAGFAGGLSVDRNFRWVKTGLQSVDTQGGFSLGPAARFVRKFVRTRVYIPGEAGIKLSVPVSGVLTGSDIGIEGDVWAEWILAKVQKNWVGLRLEGEINFSAWSSPASTTFFGWTVWVAPSYHFGQGSFFALPWS